MKKKKPWLSWLAGFTAVVIWGLSFLSIKVTLTVLPTMTQALWRHVIAAGVLLLMMRFIEPHTRLKREDIPRFVVAGLLGITLYFFLENNGIKRISASSASLIIAVVPIFTIIADALVFKEAMTKRKLVSVLISFAGVFCIVGNPYGDSNDFLGYALMLGAAVSWVVYTLVTKSLFERYSDLAIVYYQTVIGVITLIPFALFEKTDWSAVSGPVLWNLLFLGIFCSALAAYLYIISMSVIGVAISSLMMNMIPVVAVVASFFVLNERISGMQMVGGILVIGAVCLSSIGSGQGTPGDQVFCDQKKSAG